MGSVIYSSLYGILSVWITGFIIAFRKQLPCMAGMMAAMTLGMTVGLGLGVLFALWLPGQFFQSTVLSMLIGGAIGVIAGAPISMMAILDGLLSGIMGGMMGTMLMVMMPPSFAGNTVRILSVLCIGAIFLLFLMLQWEVASDFLKQKSILFSKPIFMFLFILLSLLSITFIPIHPTPDLGRHSSPPEPSTGKSGHVHDHSSNQSDASHHVDEELVVKATEFSFSPTSIRATVGQKIKITLENTGQAEHDFEIVGTNVHIHAAPGEKNSMAVSFDKAGYYQVICTLPGHKEAGMTASIQVSKP